MARNSKKLSAKSPEKISRKNELPKNIVLVGTREEKNKSIYISQKTYQKVYRFTAGKTANESGGILVGYIVNEFEKTNVVITDFIEAKYTEATPTTLKFTHDTWDYVHKEIERKHSGEKIVGWMHTHPDFGIFLSEYDVFIHKNFFVEEYQVAYVVDPVKEIEGFYFWIDKKIEKCKGFYIFDKAGTKITVGKSGDKKIRETRQHASIMNNILLGIILMVVIFLVFASISSSREMKKLQLEQETLTGSANQSLSVMQQRIAELEAEIQVLTNQLIDCGVMIAPEKISPVESGAGDETLESYGHSIEETTPQENKSETSTTPKTKTVMKLP